MTAKQHSQATLDTQHINTQTEIIANTVTCTSPVFLAVVTMEVPGDNHHLY
jgi:hypothetical protein